jgi:hypothetical protein
MKSGDRIVISIPLMELWDDRGTLSGRRLRNLDADDVKDLLQSTAFRFVIANVGDKLRWLDESDRFKFWKSEVKGHLCSAEPCFTESYTGEYFYHASEWLIEPNRKVVLLEKHH